MQLPWVRLDADGYDRVTIGSQTFLLAEGYDHFADTLSEYFPQERKALEQYVELMRHLPPMKEIGTIGAYDWLNSLFHDPLLINVLSGPALKMELRRESLPLFNFAHGMSSYIASSWRLKGSGHLMVNALVSDIQRIGGQVVCRADVNQLVEKEGRIVAARCTNGETYEGNVFISDVHPQVTFSWLGEECRLLKKTFRRRINELQNTFGMFTANIQLKEGIPYLNRNQFIYETNDIWDYASFDTRNRTDATLVSYQVPTNQSPYATNIDILTPMNWRDVEQWDGTKVMRRGDDYEEFKRRKAQQCIEFVGKYIQGLEEHVEKVYTSTPLSYKDYTSTHEGSAYGIKKDFSKLMFTMLTPRTPLPNLLLTGQNLNLHGVLGVSMTSFFTCAEILGMDKIKDLLKLR
jgi:all-trans-retinol 13,14-reductase